MKNWLIPSKFGFYAMILFFVITSASYANETKTMTQSDLSHSLVKEMQLPAQPSKDPVEEATLTADRYQRMSDVIYEHRDDIGQTNIQQSRIGFIARIEAIIAIIKTQTKKLVDLVMNDPSATTSPDSSKLNSILFKLDKERKLLINLILGQSNDNNDPNNPIANANPENPTVVDSSKSKFTVYESNNR